VIVCSCNVITDRQILEAATRAPRSPGEAYRCLGCSPDCGRCMATIHALLEDTLGPDYRFGCPACPDEASRPMPLSFAAE
jgi:bacterioferritin-associated ferredoxin